MGTLCRLPLYWHTARHLKAAQIAYRFRYAVERRLGLRARARVEHVPGALSREALAALRAFCVSWQQQGDLDTVAQAALDRNEFSFLGRTASLVPPIDWHPPDAPRLWLYHLHGFDYARDLATANVDNPNPTDEERCLAWIDEWIDNNPPGIGIGWDPFVVASRLLNWALTMSVLPLDREHIRRSIALQTAYLLRHIEYDVRANHLIKDAAALIVAGVLLGKSHRLGARALVTGMELLETELKEQTLPDGGHFERTPMYHQDVLLHCLIVEAILDEPPAFLRQTIESMARFLSRIIHTDDDIPQFGDAALNHDPPPRTLIRLAADPNAKPPQTVPTDPCYALEPSGFYVLAAPDGAGRMILKAGDPGPRYQLGHAHCDALSYELTLGSKRFVVDSGVCSYEPGPWREFCRSTSAHNTVRLNGQEQLECWDTFRVGRRYTPTPAQLRQEGAKWWFEGGYNGFGGYCHVRQVVLQPGPSWIVIDMLHGPSECLAESFIHFHPDIRVEQAGESWIARRGESVLILAPFGVDSTRLLSGSHNPLQGWHCAGFGSPTPASCLELWTKRHGKVTFGYALYTRPEDVRTGTDLDRLANQAVNRAT